MSLNVIKCESWFTNIISPCVINKGDISDWLHPTRGVRQGYSISPYLIITIAELMTITISKNNHIKGLSYQTHK